MRLSDPEYSLYIDIDQSMKDLEGIWGNFKSITSSKIFDISLDLLLDLCIALEGTKYSFIKIFILDNLIVMDMIVPDKVKKHEDEAKIQEMIKQDRSNQIISGKLRFLDSFFLRNRRKYKFFE